MKIRKAQDIFERCVSCYELTDVRKDTPVDERPNYIEGAGQLCPECWRRIYG